MAMASGLNCESREVRGAGVGVKVARWGWKQHMKHSGAFPSLGLDAEVCEDIRIFVQVPAT